MMLFNDNVLFEKYKDIIRTCVRDGYVLPFLIKLYNIPNEYKFGSKELKALYNNMNEEMKYQLYDSMCTRRKIELSVFKGESDYDNLNEYHMDELTSFIESYPMFMSIIN